MRKRVAYSQNFLRGKRLVARLINESSLNKNDTVYEIGAGQGIITEELAKVCKEVLAFEVDATFYNKLQKRFSSVPSVKIYPEDFLSHILPKSDYKVFSNIPFNITADIIKKLNRAQNPPKDSYLVVQKEAAMKYTGKPYGKRETQASVLIKPWVESTIIHQFRRSDFSPKPKIDSVLLRLRKKEKPLVATNEKRAYEDFITYAFNQWKPTLQEGLQRVFTKPQFSKLAEKLDFPLTSTPTELNFEQWLGLFHFFLTDVDDRKQKVVEGFAKRLFKQQNSLQKVHRTRTDKDWKKLRSFK